jgi:hypothetical protein
LHLLKTWMFFCHCRPPELKKGTKSG